VSDQWSDGGNWLQGNEPSLNADVLFGPHPNPPEDETVTVTNPNALRSLWFDASSGIFYTLTGDPLTLGSGLGADERMVTVISDWTSQAENNFEMGVSFANKYTARIENYSEGGLRFGGSVVYLAGDLIISGSGATHFASQLKGEANFSLEYAGATPAHLILSGENESWEGRLSVGKETLAFLKADTSLGSAKSHQVLSDGTLSWRSHLGQALDYSSPVGELHVSGQGATRQPGTDPVGAIYNDGGENTYSGDILMLRDTWFGARGDLEGSLTLSGQITGERGLTFTKVGPGLIVLTNRDNRWTTTELNAGVLRVTDSPALGGGSNLVFNGGNWGGILELTSGYGDFSANLGTGAGQVRWVGNGGFSAFGSPRTVTLNGGIALTWGQQHFVQDGSALLLGSRYADSAITFVNDPSLSAVASTAKSASKAWPCSAERLLGRARARVCARRARAFSISPTRTTLTSARRSSRMGPYSAHSRQTPTSNLMSVSREPAACS